MVALLVIQTRGAINYYDPTVAGKEPWDKVALYIKSNSVMTDVILTCPYYDEAPLKYYLTGSSTPAVYGLVLHASETRSPVEQAVQLPITELHPTIQTFNRIWLVMKDNWECNSNLGRDVVLSAIGQTTAKVDSRRFSVPDSSEFAPIEIFLFEKIR